MSRTLSNGYVVVRVEGVHSVNGVPVDSFRSEADKVILVTDDGNPEEFLDRAAEAIDDSFIAEARKAAAQAKESTIEVLYALAFKKAPLIPETSDPALPFLRPSSHA